MEYIEFRLTPEEVKATGFTDNVVFLRLLLHCFHSLAFTWENFVDGSGAISRRKKIFPIETSKIYLPVSYRISDGKTGESKHYTGLEAYSNFLSKIKPITVEQVRALIISLLKQGRYRNRTMRRLSPEAPVMQLDLHIALQSDMQRKILWQLSELRTEGNAVYAPGPFYPPDRTVDVPFVWYDESQLAPIGEHTFRIQDLK